ncbi:uncharacterized protein LOC118411287 [Branchiostoma floridae]|uniref:Uncharacterized protein LOC118411287 n=2 Tax=Branchiostoma floridae TaxID=7739 RepID=A0A9J7KTP8_BRAFL|nr:uncharacterized protein LOC118411287 [Branchiostoma floridae]
MIEGSTDPSTLILRLTWDFSTHKDLRQFEDFLTGHPDMASHSDVIGALERTRQHILWRERNEDAVRGWLARERHGSGTGGERGRLERLAGTGETREGNEDAVRGWLVYGRDTGGERGRCEGLAGTGETREGNEDAVRGWLVRERHGRGTRTPRGDGWYGSGTGGDI